ncbi:GNAT family N-acetyltransferase [Olivibacter sitiensis]|uniref:GNAT family N-acetyltransferase n=1 Tax=Olivibacter sitiensis TaxID=376470 RepID=UPI00048862C1|nr:GNAT family N-acetyltransferase [Olivibacter sitiensis]
MPIIHQIHLSESHKSQLLDLWNDEYPERLAYTNIEELNHYIHGLANCEHYLIIENNLVRAWAFKFTRDGERWFAIILSSSLHGKGLGSRLLSKLKEDESELNGWVIDHDHDFKRNGEPYPSPIEFYTKNDFKTLPSQRLESKNLSAVRIKWTLS